MISFSLARPTTITAAATAENTIMTPSPPAFEHNSQFVLCTMAAARSHANRKQLATLCNGSSLEILPKFPTRFHHPATVACSDQPCRKSATEGWGKEISSSRHGTSGNFVRMCGVLLSCLDEGRFESLGPAPSELECYSHFLW